MASNHLKRKNNGKTLKREKNQHDLIVASILVADTLEHTKKNTFIKDERQAKPSQDKKKHTQQLAIKFGSHCMIEAHKSYVFFCRQSTFNCNKFIYIL